MEGVLGIKLRALHLLGRRSTAEMNPQPLEPHFKAVWNLIRLSDFPVFVVVK